jgi:hypothetical protein
MAFAGLTVKLDPSTNIRSDKPEFSKPRFNGTLGNVSLKLMFVAGYGAEISQIFFVA